MGKVDYFKLYPNIDTLYLPIQNYIFYSANSIKTDISLDELNRKVPLGYNFFGQFIIHDMTSNPTVSFNINDIRLNNRFTMKLDLDTLYGQETDTFILIKINLFLTKKIMI